MGSLNEADPCIPYFVIRILVQMKKNSGQWSLFGRISILLLIILSHGFAHAAETHKIQGTVLTDQQKPAAGVVVVLMKIVMQDQPTISPLKIEQSDEQGRFEFIIEPAEAGSFFRIEIKTEKSATSSEPFKFKTGQFVKSVQLILPTFKEGLANLDFSRDILVFEALEAALRITEIIRFTNKSNAMVNIDSEPFIRRIPTEAQNFQLFKGDNRFTATRETDRILFKLLVPPGDNQLYFSYDLPVNKRSFAFLNHLPSQIEEMEIIVPVNTLDLSFDKHSKVSSARIIRQMKRFGNKQYDSQILMLEDDQKEITVVIKNIPISREQFYYPAIILAALLFFGLSFFLIRRAQPVSNNS